MLQRSHGTKPQLLGNETVNMQTTLAALYEGEWLPFRTHEGGETRGGEGRKGRKGRGGAELVKGSGWKEKKKCVCVCASVCVCV